MPPPDHRFPLIVIIITLLTIIFLGLVPLPFSTRTGGFAFTLPFTYAVNPYFGVTLHATRRRGINTALDYWFDRVYLVKGSLEIEGNGCSVGFGDAALPKSGAKQGR